MYNLKKGFEKKASLHCKNQTKYIEVSIAGFVGKKGVSL